MFVSMHHWIELFHRSQRKPFDEMPDKWPGESSTVLQIWLWGFFHKAIVPFVWGLLFLKDER